MPSKTWIALSPVVAVGILLTILATRRRFTIDETESVTVHAPADEVWAFISDFEGNWEDSNPEHDGTRVLTDPKTPLRDGLRFWQRERVGGVVGEFEAELYDVEPNRKFRWRGDVTYSIYGINISFPEGGTFRVEPTSDPDAMRLSHRIWGRLPGGLSGRVLSWFLVNLFDIDRAAAQHTLVELEYFKSHVET